MRTLLVRGIMIIRSIAFDKYIKWKILKKHNVTTKEVEEVMFSNPFITKTKESRYIVIGRSNRYLTVVFEYKSGVAEIITAYPSSLWQIKLFKKKRG